MPGKVQQSSNLQIFASMKSKAEGGVSQYCNCCSDSTMIKNNRDERQKVKT